MKIWPLVLYVTFNFVKAMVGRDVNVKNEDSAFGWSSDGVKNLI